MNPYRGGGSFRFIMQAAAAAVAASKRRINPPVNKRSEEARALSPGIGYTGYGQDPHISRTSSSWLTRLAPGTNRAISRNLSTTTSSSSSSSLFIPLPSCPVLLIPPLLVLGSMARTILRVHAFDLLLLLLPPIDSFHPPSSVTLLVVDAVSKGNDRRQRILVI